MKRIHRDTETERTKKRNHNFYIANVCRSIDYTLTCGTVNSIHYRAHSSLHSRSYEFFSSLLPVSIEITMVMQRKYLKQQMQAHWRDFPTSLLCTLCTHICQSLDTHCRTQEETVCVLCVCVPFFNKFQNYISSDVCRSKMACGCSRYCCVHLQSALSLTKKQILSLCFFHSQNVFLHFVQH